MDPTNQTNTTQTTQATDGNTQPNATSTIIAGAFWGVTNTQAPNADTLPAFSFDENEFTNTSTPNRNDNIADPFSAGISSVTTNNITNQTPIIENNNTESTFSLDSLEPQQETWIQPTYETSIPQPQAPEPIQASEATTIASENNEFSFELPIEPTTEDINTTNTNTTQTPENNTSFDLPSTTQDTTVPTFNFNPTPATIEEPITEGIAADNNTTTIEYPSIETTTENETISNDSQDPIVDIESPVIEIPTEPEYEVDSSIDTDEQEESLSEDVEEDIPSDELSESRETQTHELQESYTDFQTALNNYISFKKEESITITGLRTDEEEINYTFTQQENWDTTITKSNASDTLSFHETDSGLQTYINEDIIGYYGIDEIDPETTHYLKEKLGKFTMMLESEYDKEIRKEKEGLKKIKETLKNF